MQISRWSSKHHHVPYDLSTPSQSQKSQSEMSSHCRLKSEEAPSGCYCYSMPVWDWYLMFPLRFPCLAVSPSSSGLAVAESVRPRWSQSVGRTTKPTWTPASWSRRTAGPGVWAASPRNTTDPAARSGGRRRGTTSINNAASFLLPVTMLHCGNITISSWWKCGCWVPIE